MNAPMPAEAGTGDRLGGSIDTDGTSPAPEQPVSLADVYGTSTTKRTRPTKVEFAEFSAHLFAIVEADRPVSVRHVYYRAVVAGMVPKNDKGYRRVQHSLAKMRRAGEMPYGWISDNTRSCYRPQTYSSMGDALNRTAAYYRRDLWDRSSVQVEVWCESESIAGVIREVTTSWGIGLYPTKGFSSMSFTHGAAEELSLDGRPAAIFYVGDHDPAGLDIERCLRVDLAEHATVPIDFRRVGVTWEQVEEMGLPGTPPKSSKNYEFPEAVEAEALPAPVLRELLDLAISEHANQDDLDAIHAAEESERALLGRIARREFIVGEG